MFPCLQPLTAAIHVTVFKGREILPMDGSKDDPGGLSDPYCEVTLEHEKTPLLRLGSRPLHHSPATGDHSRRGDTSR